MKNPKNKVVVILGPTSSGKSETALQLAKKFDGEVISADSRQVYKDMSLGTGKVDGKWKKKENGKIFEYENIPHHLIDFCSPKKEYNISHFKNDCEKLIDEITAKGKLAIICGGTGFWISAIVDSIILPEVKPNKKLRYTLSKKKASELFEILKKIDPDRSKTIDSQNKFRLIRAIEIAKELGKVPAIKKIKNQNSDFFQIGIDWPQEKLDQKIKKRLDLRWEQGMTEEVENLRKKYDLSWEKIQSFGLGYFWIPEFLLGKISQEELQQKVFISERRYAKKQRTWFKRDKRILWQNDYKKIEKSVKDFLEK